MARCMLLVLASLCFNPNLAGSSPFKKRTEHYSLSRRGLEEAIRHTHWTVMNALQMVREESPVRTYEGGLYGVSALVELNMQTREADVSLSGIVLGGTLSGTGRLESPTSESGGVVLDEDLAYSLARRYITIKHASLNRENDTVCVAAVVPLLGDIEIYLVRKHL